MFLDPQIYLIVLFLGWGKFVRYKMMSTFVCGLYCSPIILFQLCRELLRGGIPARLVPALLPSLRLLDLPSAIDELRPALRWLLMGNRDLSFLCLFMRLFVVGFNGEFSADQCRRHHFMDGCHGNICTTPRHPLTSGLVAALSDQLLPRCDRRTQRARVRYVSLLAQAGLGPPCMPNVMLLFVESFAQAYNLTTFLLVVYYAILPSALIGFDSVARPPSDPGD